MDRKWLEMIPVSDDIVAGTAYSVVRLVATTTV